MQAAHPPSVWLPSWHIRCAAAPSTPRRRLLQALNPYGRSKLIIEDMLRDLFAAEQDWRIVLLRYFNPVGAHPSGGRPSSDMLVHST